MTYPGQAPDRRRWLVVTAVLAAVVAAAGVVVAVVLGPARSTDGHQRRSAQAASAAQVMTQCGARTSDPIPKINAGSVMSCLIGKIVVARATPSMRALVEPLQDVAGVGSQLASASPQSPAGAEISMLSWLTIGHPMQNYQPAYTRLNNILLLEVVWKAVPRDGSTAQWCRVIGYGGVGQEHTGSPHRWALTMAGHSGSASCSDTPIDVSNFQTVPQ